MTEEQRVEAAKAALLEHFDSVQIFVTSKSGEGKDRTTDGIDCGGGNFYARIGQVREWILTQDEYVRANANRSQQQRFEEDSE